MLIVSLPNVRLECLSSIEFIHEVSKSNNVRSNFKKKVSLTAANIGLQQLTGAKTLAFTDRKVHDILKMSPQYGYHQREVSFADLFTYIGLYPSNIAT